MEKQDQAVGAVGGERDQSVLRTEGEYHSVTIWAHKDKANFFGVKYIGLPLSRALSSWYCRSAATRTSIRKRYILVVRYVYCTNHE